MRVRVTNVRISLHALAIQKCQASGLQVVMLLSQRMRVLQAWKVYTAVTSGAGLGLKGGIQESAVVEVDSDLSVGADDLDGVGQWEEGRGAEHMLVARRAVLVALAKAWVAVGHVGVALGCLKALDNAVINGAEGPGGAFLKMREGEVISAARSLRAALGGTVNQLSGAGNVSQVTSKGNVSQVTSKKLRKMMASPPKPTWRRNRYGRVCVPAVLPSFPL